MSITFYSPILHPDVALEEARREATAAHFWSLIADGDSEVDEDKRGVIRIPDGLKCKWKDVK